MITHGGTRVGTVDVRVRRSGYQCIRMVIGRLALATLPAMIGCDLNIGPDTPSARFELSGAVTAASDGFPLEGVKLFLTYTGCGDDPSPLCLTSGDLASDTVSTDPNGRYRLTTRYYCPAGLRAIRQGFAEYRSPSMMCPAGGVVTQVFSVALTRSLSGDASPVTWGSNQGEASEGSGVRPAARNMRVPPTRLAPLRSNRRARRPEK